MARELTSSGIAQVVTAVGVASVLGIGALLMKAGNVQNEVAFVQSAVASIRGTVYTHSDAAYVTTANIAAGKLVPDNRISGSSITSAWGSLTFAPANVSGNANDGFTLSYPAGLSLRDCKALVDGVAQLANTVSINSTSAKDNNGVLDETVVDAQCAATTGTVAFGFTKAGT